MKTSSPTNSPSEFVGYSSKDDDFSQSSFADDDADDREEFLEEDEMPSDEEE